MKNDIKDSLLIIFEKDLNNRYEYFVNHTEISTLKLNLDNRYEKNLLKTIYRRVLYKKELEKSKKIILQKCANKKYIFVSNSEGFIALNLIVFMKKNLNCKIISLQHGIFEFIKWPSYKKFVKLVINSATRIIFGIQPIGLGFGHKIADKYIVYCDEYKNFLVSRGWHDNDVIVSSFFLKGKENDPLIRKKDYQYNRNVLLILQPMSASGMMKWKTENNLYTKVIKVLLKKFDKIYIRQHPFKRVNLEYSSKNIIETNETSLIEDLNMANTVISFMSTVLVDYEEMEKEFISIYTKHLSFYSSSYVAFNKIYYIDDDNNFSFKITDNPNRKRKYFYQTGVSSIKNLYQAIL
jgi:hypothetical protein